MNVVGRKTTTKVSRRTYYAIYVQISEHIMDNRKTICGGVHTSYYTQSLLTAKNLIK